MDVCHYVGKIYTAHLWAEYVRYLFLRKSGNHFGSLHVERVSFFELKLRMRYREFVGVRVYVAPSHSTISAVTANIRDNHVDLLKCDYSRSECDNIAPQAFSCLALGAIVLLAQ